MLITHSDSLGNNLRISKKIWRSTWRCSRVEYTSCHFSHQLVTVDLRLYDYDQVGSSLLGIGKMLNAWGQVIISCLTLMINHTSCPPNIIRRLSLKHDQ